MLKLKQISKGHFVNFHQPVDYCHIKWWAPQQLESTNTVASSWASKTIVSRVVQGIYDTPAYSLLYPHQSPMLYLSRCPLFSVGYSTVSALRFLVAIYLPAAWCYAKLVVILTHAFKQFYLDSSTGKYLLFFVKSSSLV